MLGPAPGIADGMPLFEAVDPRHEAEDDGDGRRGAHPQTGGRSSQRANGLSADGAVDPRAVMLGPVPSICHGLPLFEAVDPRHEAEDDGDGRRGAYPQTGGLSYQRADGLSVDGAAGRLTGGWAADGAVDPRAVMLGPVPSICHGLPLFEAVDPRHEAEDDGDGRCGAYPQTGGRSSQPADGLSVDGAVGRLIGGRAADGAVAVRPDWGGSPRRMILSAGVLAYLQSFVHI
jgi:hypothetical protein